MKKIFSLIVGFAVVAAIFLAGCSQSVQSVSGTKMVASGSVKTNKDGLTAEQQAVHDRIQMDNTPGAIKHLYVISAYSGQVILYSTVRVKVTSSKKKLTPDRVWSNGSSGSLFSFNIGGQQYLTDQVLGEDGTYGESIEYLYWWDAKDIYHQHYVTGGEIIHISNQPIVVKGIIINMELTQKQ